VSIKSLCTSREQCVGRRGGHREFTVLRVIITVGSGPHRHVRVVSMPPEMFHVWDFPTCNIVQCHSCTGAQELSDHPV
jgi:hypothetical protein